MKLSDEVIIPVPRIKVWEALNDAELLRQCIPGCEEIIKKSDTEMEAKVTVKMGPVKASFKGAVTLSELDLSFRPQSKKWTSSGNKPVVKFHPISRPSISRSQTARRPSA